MIQNMIWLMALAYVGAVADYVATVRVGRLRGKEIGAIVNIAKRFMSHNSAVFITLILRGIMIHTAVALPLYWNIWMLGFLTGASLAAALHNIILGVKKS